MDRIDKLLENVNLHAILNECSLNEIEDYTINIVKNNIEKYNLKPFHYYDIGSLLKSLIFLKTHEETYQELKTSMAFYTYESKISLTKYNTEPYTIFTRLVLLNTNDIYHRFFFDETDIVKITTNNTDRYIFKKFCDLVSWKYNLILNDIKPNDNYLQCKPDNVFSFEKILKKENIPYNLIMESEDRIIIHILNDEDFMYLKLLLDEI